MSKYLSQYAYARQIGKSKQYVNTLVQQGVIKLVNKKIDPEQADKAIEDNSSPARAEYKKGGGRAPISFKEAQTAKEVARAKLAQIQVKEKEGELVNAADMVRQGKAAFNVVRSRIRSIAPKCSQKIAALKVSNMTQRELIAEIEELLRKEHDEALEELSRHRD